MLNEKGIMLQYKKAVKQFYLSKTTKVHIISALIKRVFHLQNDLKGLKHPRGYQIPIQDVFNFAHGIVFQVVADEDTSEDRSRSETFSQKALTKVSGRKYPPQQKQLLDAKLFIDDFQFFMTQVAASHKDDQLFGILFFNSKKQALYFGRKFLRELIYEHDQIQFFYALHPLKRHSTSMLLGETIIFSLFKGRKMVNEREFPENMSAIEEINGYLKCLYKNGDIVLQETNREHHNLIQVSEQRSVDDKVEKKQMDFDFDVIPKKIVKSNTIQLVSPIAKLDSPIKSQLTNEVNEISFQNDFYEPDWFEEGEHLNRLEKSFLAALIKQNDANLISFCHGLDLKNKNKQKLNIDLMKVFLKDIITKKMVDFNEDERFLVELNQQNRHSYVFSLLLKLKKFGNIDDFVGNLRKQMSTLIKNKCSYVQLARQIEKKRNNKVIKLKDCEQNEEDKGQEEEIILIGKHHELNEKYNKIADVFHRSTLHTHFSLPVLPNDYTEGEKAMIKDLLLRRDPFLIESFIPSKWSKKKFVRFKPCIVKKYMDSMEHRYRIFRDFPFDENIKKKYEKLQHFLSLLYYLYKQRTINKKQQKAFCYLYIWSDLNVLSAFQLYCLDRNLQDFIETIYTIDYTYYLQGKYGLDMNEVENFTLQIQQQLIILFLVNQFIENTAQKTAIQKFIRAGDNKLMSILNDSKGQEDLINKIIQNALEKKEKLEIISQEPEDQQAKRQREHSEMKKFIESIIPVHFKDFKKKNLVFECIDEHQPLIISIFEVYYSTNELVEWIDSFKLYITQIDETHMHIVITKLANLGRIEMEKINHCQNDLIRGVYDVYLQTKDQNDAIETLQRIVQKSIK